MKLKSMWGQYTVLANGTNPLLLLDGQIIIRLDSALLCHYDIEYASAEDREKLRRARRQELP